MSTDSGQQEVEQGLAEVPLDDLTDDAGVREAFELYEAAAVAYTVATSHNAIESFTHSSTSTG